MCMTRKLKLVKQPRTDKYFQSGNGYDDGSAIVCLVVTWAYTKYSYDIVAVVQKTLCTIVCQTLVPWVHYEVHAFAWFVGR